MRELNEARRDYVAASRRTEEVAKELKEAEDDLVVEAEGVRVLIDPQSGEYLKGATIDFVTSIEGTGFVFDNPNAQGGCGCGKSFC